MAHVPDERRKKLDKKSTECIFLGYPDEVKRYRLLNIATRKIMISRDVIFFENSTFAETSPDNCVEFPILLKTQLKLREDVIDNDDNDDGGSTPVNNTLAASPKFFFCEKL